MIRLAAALAFWAAPVAAETILSADYAGPTDRYAHGVLGDAIEWSELRIVTDRQTYRFSLPTDRVFEDLAPRLADIDNDGGPEVIVVEAQATCCGCQYVVLPRSCPYLAKTLRIWRFKDGELVEVAAGSGLTNHRIGEDFISGGLRDCGQGPQMVTADANWSRVVATRLIDGQLQAVDLGAYVDRGSFATALACEKLP